MANDAIQVRPADWARDEKTLRDIRTEVFVQGQDVTAEEEWDGLDGDCYHVIAYDGDAAIGTGRMQADGCIGRMAVRAAWRGRGAGSRILEALIAEARRRGLPRVYLGSQVQAIPFYERLGFVAHGGVYLDARMPHRKMELAF